MIRPRKSHVIVIVCSLNFIFPALSAQAKFEDEAAIIQKIDAAVAARDDGIESYSVNEHYTVFRGQDDANPVAEMLVKTTYAKSRGKSFAILEQSGSEILRKQVLETILDREKDVSQPGNRPQAVITSSNYEMMLKGSEIKDGRSCIAVSLKPKRSSPFLFNGVIWTDAVDGSIHRLEGMASKSASIFAGPAQVTRQYASIDGFPMAVHAQAVSNSWLLGKTIIKIDYLDYEIHAAVKK